MTTSYDAQGRVTQIAGPEGRVNYEYDDLGRKIRTYTTDETGNVVNDFRYSYDELGRLETVEAIERNDVLVDSDGDPSNGSQPETTRYEYDIVGNLDEVYKPNGVIEDFVYDELNRLTKLTHYKPDATPNDLSDNEKLAEFAYTVLSNGKRSGATETFWYDEDGNGTPEAHTNTVTWEYDELGRLTDETFSDPDFIDSIYTYDLTGNRTKLEKDTNGDGLIDETTRYTYDANDRLFKEEVEDDGDGDFDDKVTTYGYDHTQQTSKEVKEDGELKTNTSFAYDLQGRMEVVIKETLDANGDVTQRERTTYDYNAMGIRISALHEVDGEGDGTYETATKTEYLNDPQNHTGYSQVLQETVIDPATGEIQKRIIYTIGLDHISQTTIKYVAGVPQSSKTRHFHMDGHGSTRVLTDTAAAIAEVSGVKQIFHYDAYGNAIGFLPAEAVTSILYSGEMFDSRIGQQYLRARWYDPATGRLNPLDPFFGNLQDPQSLHKYLYVLGDPVNMIDPTGRMGTLGSTITAMSIGGAIGGFAVGGIDAALGGGDAFDIIAGMLTDAVIGAIGGAAFGLLAGTLPVAGASFTAVGGTTWAFGASGLIALGGVGTALGVQEALEKEHHYQASFRLATGVAGSALFPFAIVRTVPPLKVRQIIKVELASALRRWWSGPPKGIRLSDKSFIGRRINADKQADHVRASVDDMRSYVDDLATARGILDEFHSGRAIVLDKDLTQNRVLIQSRDYFGTHRYKDGSVIKLSDRFIIKGKRQVNLFPVDPNRTSLYPNRAR